MAASSTQETGCAAPRRRYSPGSLRRTSLPLPSRADDGRLTIRARDFGAAYFAVSQRLAAQIDICNGVMRDRESKFDTIFSKILKNQVYQRMASSSRTNKFLLTFTSTVRSLAAGADGIGGVDRTTTRARTCALDSNRAFVKRTLRPVVSNYPFSRLARVHIILSVIPRCVLITWI